MADVSSGASGASGSQNSAGSQASQAQAQAQAADEANKATEAQLAAAAAAVGAMPTPAVTMVDPAPVDLSVSVNAISQLSAMQVSTPSLDFSSLSSLGGLPTAASYADIAQMSLASPVSPTTPSLTAVNDFAPSFSIDGFNAADIANTDIGAVSVNVGLNYTGDFNTSINARMGLSPPSATFTGTLGFTDTVNSLNFTATAGPFGTAAAPNYGIGVNTDFSVGAFDKVNASAVANFNATGFQNSSATLGLTHDFTEGLVGTASGTASFDRDGMSNVGGAFGLGVTGENGFNAGFNANGSYDPRTGEFTGYAGVRIGGKF
jgi:hypothetical protein